MRRPRWRPAPGSRPESAASAQGTSGPTDQYGPVCETLRGVGALTDHLQNLNQGWLYLIVGLLVCVEYAGLLLPGETAALLAGALSSSGHAHVSVVVLVVVGAAIAGDCIGYEIGRRFGPRLLQLRFLTRYERRIGQAMAFLDRRGG